MICPAIEPNEETGVRSALETFDDLAQRFERFGVALLHGQLAPEQKQLVKKEIGKEVDAVELTAKELEERIAPIALM